MTPSAGSALRRPLALVEGTTPDLFPGVAENAKCDALIVDGGITGSLVDLIAGSSSPLLTYFALDRDGKPGRAHGDGAADAGAPLLRATT